MRNICKKCLNVLLLLTLFSHPILCKSQVIITNTKTNPFGYICKVIKYSGGKRFVGTGTLVNHNSLLTNAHITHDADSLIVIPGLNRSEIPEPFGETKVICKKDSNVFYPKIFDTEKDSELDYSIVKLNTSNEMFQQIETSVGKNFGLSAFDFNAPKPDSLHIAGFPVYHWFEFKGNKWKQMSYNSTHDYEIINNRIFRYKLNTRGGNSGSPLWILSPSGNAIIGIHKSGKGHNDEGVIFTSDIVQQLEVWLNK